MKAKGSDMLRPKTDRKGQQMKEGENLVVNQ
jgi:hypothetical protein